MSLTGEALLKELERKANDECEVINPTLEPFHIDWDGYTWAVPDVNTDRGYGKGRLRVPRYIAMYYIKHMTDKLINLEWEQAVKKDKKAFEARGEWFGQKEIQIAPRTNDEKLRAKHFKSLWGGVKRKFGQDERPDTGSRVQRDTRPITERLMEEADIDTEDFLAQVEEQDNAKE